jgi:subtilisin family serine protease
LRRRSTRSRATIALLATGLTLGGGSVAAASSGTGSPDDPVQGQEIAKRSPAKDKLGQHDRELLADAVADHDRTVTVLLATQERRTGTVSDAVRRLGGSVGYRNDRLGYVRATVPTASVKKAAALSDVLKVDLNESIPLPDPRTEAVRGKTGKAQAAPVKGPSRTTPDANPFMPTNETGAVSWKKAHPTLDGRGTTIGILDSGVDLDHPALQRTSTGQRKIVDWVTAVDPLLEGDRTWRPMRTTGTGPRITFGGVTYRTPAGSFAINTFAEAITAPSEPAGDVNRDGDTTDVWGVLYDPATHDIWVDVDQDHDFTDETRMRPYREAFQVGHFGKDNPATKNVVERMPFVVEYREDVDLTPAGLPGEKADFVNIGLVEDAHGSHVAGITAANGMFGGSMDGAAPGAKLVSSRACTWGGGCTAVALTEGMIDLVVNRRVDVVNMSIGGLPALNDGANARTELYDRLIDDFGVQLFLSGGNSGPGINTVGDPGVATKVVTAASSISKTTWRANYGSVVSSNLNLHNFSSRGPREDGGFKPDVMAPGSAVSTVPRWLKQPDVAEAGYTLPAGYAMFNGTSMASPQTAGAAALLLSAARATDRAVTPAQLRKALYSTADFVKGIPAMGQGAGQVDVRGAWTQLRRLPSVRSYTVSAPVCTAISQFLATPNRGTGVYNRCAAGAGGQRAGERRSYDITITRTSGPAGARPHSLSWLGNDGTWTAPSSVSLTRGRPTTIRVTARPGAGVHSAILRVNDRITTGQDLMVLNTVVTARSLPRPSYATTTSSTVERNRTKSLFVNVPAGTKALQVNLSRIATGSQTRFIAFNPYGVPVEDTSSLTCYTNFSDAKVCPPNSRSYANPIPGVWEIEVESRRTTPFLKNPYRLTAAAQGVTVTPERVTLASVKKGTPTPVSWTVRNDFGPVAVRTVGGPLGSAKDSRETIGKGQHQEFQVEVPAGASRLDVAIGNPSDLSADLDLTVLKDGVVVAQSADGDSEEAVSIDSPAAGTYTVQVDGFDVPSGSTGYDYRDVFFSSSLGQLATPAGQRALAPGAATTVQGTMTAEAAPVAGRVLFGEMRVLSSEGAPLGSGTVLVREVRP